MKKLLIVCLVFISAIISVKANVESYPEVDFSKSNTVLTSYPATTEELSNGVTYGVANTRAYNNGIEQESKLNNFTVSWIDSSLSNGVTMANWSKNSLLVWTGSRVTSLAKDFETANPGYLVIGGINCDFFHIQTTCETSNLCLQNGDLYKPYVLGEPDTGVLGWRRDGSFIWGRPEISKSMYFDIMGEDGEYGSPVEISTVNVAPGETGIGLLTGDLSFDLDLTGYKVVKVTYIIHRHINSDNAKHNRLFIKGTVAEIVDGEPGFKQTEEITCYLVSKDGSLDNVSTGDTIRCQYHLLGDWADVYNAAGYHDMILKDGESLFYQANLSDYSGLVPDINYINCAKNRTIIGQKPDGSIVYMTIEYYHKSEGDGHLGASYYECAEYLRLLGCVNGWLVDGGGSTTLVLSKENTFEMVAGGSDGEERNDGNGLFMVMKNPGFTPTVVGKEHNSLTIKIAPNDSYGIHNVSDIELEYNGKSQKVELGKEYTINDLPVNATSTFKFKYNINGSSEYIVKHFSTSDYPTPNLQLETLAVSNNAVLVKPIVNANPKYIEKVLEVCLIIDNKEYVVTPNELNILEGFNSYSIYRPNVRFKCIDKITGDTYERLIDNRQFSGVSFTTDSKYRPLIKKFEFVKLTETTAELAYEIYDPENKLSKLVLKGIDETILDTSSKEGTCIVEDIDCVSSTFEFQLRAYAGDEYSDSIVLSTEGQDITPTEPGPVEPINKGCGNAAMYIIFETIAITAMLYIIKKH